MKAMVLAAGEGTRLRPLTDDVPKPMVPIAGKPLLEYNLRLLAKYGIQDITINLHHRPERVTEFFGDGAALGLRLNYSREPELLGTAGAVKKVESWFDGTFLVMYGDNLTNCDLGRLCDFHRSKGGVGTVALFWREDPTSSGIAELDDRGRILRFVEKPKPEEVFSHWVSAGVLVLEKEVLKRIPAERPSDFGREILPSLLPEGIYGYRMSEGLWWVDTPEDYGRVDKLAREGKIP